MLGKTAPFRGRTFVLERNIRRHPPQTAGLMRLRQLAGYVNLAINDVDEWVFTGLETMLAPLDEHGTL